jgi:hypothetical protein
MYLLKILAFVATITAKNNYHGTNQKRDTIKSIARIFSKYTKLKPEYYLVSNCKNFTPKKLCALEVNLFFFLINSFHNVAQKNHLGETTTETYNVLIY